MRALSMLLTNDLMKGRRINDVSINNILLFFSFQTNGFHITVGLFSNRPLKSQNVERTSIL